jgi:hypothetical protein
VWWNGINAGGVSILRWIVCGVLLAVLAMAKGPRPAGFFALGTAAYLILERRWRDLPGWFLCMVLPLAATIAWGAAVYQKGDETQWLNYARLTWPYPTLLSYIVSNGRSTVSLLLELLPATLILPFVISAWRRNRTGPLLRQSLERCCSIPACAQRRCWYGRVSPAATPCPLRH